MIAQALWFYQFNSWKNRLVTRIRRLRQPKYLFGGVVGALWFYFYFLRPFFMSRNGAMPTPDPESLEIIHTVMAAVFFGLAILAWVMPSDRAGLTFSEAEVAFLFSAPISRRTLIHFKLLKTQTGIFFTALLMTLIGARWGGTNPVFRAAGWWIILSTINLHALASSFGRTMLLDRGLTPWKRRLAILLPLVLLIGWGVLYARSHIPATDVSSLTSYHSIMDYLSRVTNSGPVFWALLPIRVMLGPYFAASWPAFLTALPSALLLLGLHYWWVVKADVAFEEASIDQSRNFAEKMSARRSGNWQSMSKPRKARRTPFTLRATGSPAIALFWKNLLSAGQVVNFRLFIVLLQAVIIGSLIGHEGPAHGGLGAIVGLIALILFGMTFVMGPQLLRHDLRQDLLMTDVLKTYPMSGRQIVLGEILAPAAILTAVQWLLIILAALLFPVPAKQQQLFLIMRPAIGISAFILSPFINFVFLLIPNAAALLFPAWFHLGKESAQGVEVMGQRIIMMLGQVLFLAVSLLPAAGLYFLMMWLGNSVIGPIPSAILGSILAAATLGVESWFGVQALGRLFEKFDLSAELNG